MAWWGGGMVVWCGGGVVVEWVGGLVGWWCGVVALKTLCSARSSSLSAGLSVPLPIVEEASVVHAFSVVISALSRVTV